MEHAAQPQRLLGVVLGGAIYAASFGVFSPSPTYTSGGILASESMLPLIVLLLAGVAMGVGARTAGGCTPGHGRTGMALGSPASIIATIAFFATGVALAHLLAWF